MSGQAPLLIGVATAVLLVVVYLTSLIIENDTGSLSATVRTVGVCLAIWALVQPKFGLYIVTIEAFSLDFLKKLAVYYGTVSSMTIIEVLVVGMLAVLATVVGILIQSVCFRQYKLRLAQWVVVVVTILVTAALFLAMLTKQGMAKAGEDAFNSGFYIALALPMSVALADRQQLNKLLGLQFWMAAIWAAWGIKQYYFGFTFIEWFYAETGLSFVASEHMLRFADPRPMGFGSGSPNYSVISAYAVYGIWRVWTMREKRFWWIVGTFIVLWGTVTSMQRTTILLVPLAFAFYYFYSSALRTIAVYSASALTLLIGILNADTLIERLDDINNMIETHGRWGEQVMVVSTYEARIVSWQLLLRPGTWTWLGVEDTSQGAHDLITRAVLSYGIVGLVVSLISLCAIFYFVHSRVLRIVDPQDRQFATMMLAIVGPSILVAMAGGGNFTASPVNVQTWTFFGAVFTLVVNSQLVETMTDKRRWWEYLLKRSAQTYRPMVTTMPAH